MCLSLYKVWLLAELQVHPEVSKGLPFLTDRYFHNTPLHDAQAFVMNRVEDT
jgi:hypothetical protein